MLTDEVEEVIVDGKNGFETAKKLTKNIVPNKFKNIKLLKTKKIPYLARIILSLKLMNYLALM